MFTGIIEERGRIADIQRKDSSAEVTVQCQHILAGTKIGDSIAVNGICLTVTSILDQGFTADVMPETMNRTSIGETGIGGIVNLERAMAADGRFGGHIVAGHIDGVGTIAAITADENAVWYTVEAPGEILRYIIEKGSIAMDGISLTVASTGRNHFKVSVIPHTRQQTNLPEKEIGSRLNLEVDMVGKYIEKLINQPEKPRQEELTETYLREHGF